MAQPLLSLSDISLLINNFSHHLPLSDMSQYLPASNSTALLNAEQSLGRPLTSAETLWLTLTAGQSDYAVYSAAVVALSVIYTLACIPYVVLDYLRLPFFEQFRVQANSWNPSGKVWRSYLDTIWTTYALVLPLQLLTVPVYKVVGISTGLPLPSLELMALQIVVFFIVEDYFNYWLHRWLHCGWGYSKIHYMHHEFNSPSAVAASYAHWGEIVVLGIPTFMGPALVGCHAVTFFIWIYLRELEAMDIHSGYSFPWNPTRLIPFYGGADFHDYHHEVGGTSHCNFASIFTYCDWLYGTDKGYYAKRRAQRELAVAKKII